jgi:formylmethanofuran dehydrogenase subunit E
VIYVTQSIKPFSDAIAFHGHSCPGLALGYRAAEYALSSLDASRPADEDLVAVVENDACGIDAIQVIAGCSAGKGNLIFRDFGKHAYMFINRKTGKGVRLAQHPEPFMERLDPVISALRLKVFAGTATPEEQAEFHNRQAAMVGTILAMPIENLFTITEMKPEIPEKARIFRSVQCAFCGEMVAEHRARVRDGKFACIPCAGDYSWGW